MVRVGSLIGCANPASPADWMAAAASSQDFFYNAPNSALVVRRAPARGILRRYRGVVVFFPGGGDAAVLAVLERPGELPLRRALPEEARSVGRRVWRGGAKVHRRNQARRPHPRLPHRAGEKRLLRAARRQRPAPEPGTEGEKLRVGRGPGAKAQAPG